MDANEAKALFRGPMVSVATPFTSDYELDLDALRRNIRFMVDRGMATGRGVLLVAAAGGEFPMLTMEERKRVISASVEAAAGQIAVAASLQFVGTRQVVEIARYAHRVGASLGQLSAPYYYPPSIDDIVQLFQDSSDQAELPLMVYANWWNTPNMNVETVARLAEIPNVVSVKWSAPTPGEFTEGVDRFHNSLAVVDNENMCVWSHMLGAVSFITHVSNFWPEYPLAIWDVLEAHDYPGAVVKLSEFQWQWGKWAHKVGRETEGEGPFIKAAMRLVGLDVGPARLPARPLSSALLVELETLFADVGVPGASA